jgi:NAD(P)-dependent dehydrogenase (short-subunit alcohol dehydrogenase family)
MSDNSRIRHRFDLGGKVALLTGASKGIGESMARGMAEFGARVVVSSRKQEAVDAVADSLREDGLDAVAIAANVGNPDDISTLLERTLERCGGIDILVNNAAANPVFGPIQDTDERAFDKIIDVNLRGPFELCKRVYPIMRARGGGSIINISSIGGVTPEAGIGIYSVSKAAILNMTQAMAQDWGRDNIRVNAICPGLIRTRFSEALWSNDEILERFLRHTPLGRPGEADEVAGLACFLASDAAAYCSGGAYNVDGGYLAN